MNYNIVDVNLYYFVPEVKMNYEIVSLEFLSVCFRIISAFWSCTPAMCC